jgi:hypothetical protein
LLNLSRFVLLGLLWLDGTQSSSTEPPGVGPKEASPARPSAAAPAVEIDFCQIRPRYPIPETNTSFTAVFSFEVGEDGGPVNLHDSTRLTREDARRWGWPEKYITQRYPDSPIVLWLGDEGFPFRCISDWRLRGIPKGTQLQAEFKWHQGLGWESLRIVGQGVNLTIKASTDGRGPLLTVRPSAGASEGRPFGPVTEQDVETLNLFAKERGLDLTAEAKAMYGHDEEALAKVFRFSLQFGKLDQNARTYGQILYSSLLNLGEEGWLRTYAQVLNRQSPQVQQRVRDFLYYPTTRVPVNERKQIDRDLRQDLPMLFPSHYEFAAEDPFWGGQ